MDLSGVGRDSHGALMQTIAPARPTANNELGLFLHSKLE